MRNSLPITVGIFSVFCFIGCTADVDAKDSLFEQQSKDLTADCFAPPTSNFPGPTTCMGFGASPWLDQYCSSGNPFVHTAQDDCIAAGSPVYAAGNGTITEVYNAGTCPTGASWGMAIYIQHTLSDGSTVHTQYMHVNPTFSGYVGVGAYNVSVNKGDQIGTIRDLSSCNTASHVHFGVWAGARTPCYSAPGNDSCRGALPQFDGCGNSHFSAGFVKPVDFINNHSICPTPSQNCPVGSNWYGAGYYCGKDPGMGSGCAADTLYYCAAAGYYAQPSRVCPNATGGHCITAPPYQNDYCGTPACPDTGHWYGAGRYCGTEPGMSGVANSNALFYCSCPYCATSLVQICPNYCVWAPPGYNDYCQ
jgi:hypothetical protein